MSLEENKIATFRVFEEIWSQGKLEVSDEVLAPDFIFRLGVPPFRIDGIESFNKLVTRNRIAWQDLTYIPDKERTVAEGDIVITPWTMTAKHVGTWVGYTGSDKEVSIEGMTLYHFVDGMIADAHVQNEVLSLIRQIGGLPPPGVGTEFKIVEANKALVRRYIDEILIAGNFAVAEELVTPDFSIERSALPDAIAGPDALQKQMEMLKTAFPDLDLQVADLIANEDKVAVRFEAPGTHLHEFAGIAPTGRKVTWKGNVLYQIVDGKIAHAWANWDDVGLIQSLK